MRTLPLLALLLPFLAGCLEMDQTITLAADGSGTQTVKMTIRDATLAEVQRVSAAAGAVSEATKALFDKELTRRDLERHTGGLEVAASRSRSTRAATSRPPA